MLVIAVTACWSIAQAQSSYNSKGVFAVASVAGNFNTPITALKAAGLVETLQGPGLFIVFAPTDEAFAELPKCTLEDLLKPENKSKFAGILTYHVVPGKFMAADVKHDGQDRQRRETRY